MRLKIPVKIEPGFKTDTGSRLRDVHIPIPLFDESESPEFKILGTKWNPLLIVIEEEKSVKVNNRFTEKVIERTSMEIIYSDRDGCDRISGTAHLEIDTSEKTVIANMPRILREGCCRYELDGYDQVVSEFKDKDKIGIPLKLLKEQENTEEKYYVVEKYIYLYNIKKEKIVRRTYKPKEEKEKNIDGFLKLIADSKSIFVEIPVDNGRILLGNIDSIAPELMLKTKIGEYVITTSSRCRERIHEKYNVFIKADKDKNKLVIKYKNEEYKISPIVKYFKLPIEKKEKFLLVFGNDKNIINEVRKEYGE
ncbi:MAG: hypothetical protein JHC31_12620 [Sulfurihydrogenibium sp.]|jgi:hypothetical protein|nr:hypothetical protein [Sulfurihydrogenibium sp.]